MYFILQYLGDWENWISVVNITLAIVIGIIWGRFYHAVLLKYHPGISVTHGVYAGIILAAVTLFQFFWTYRCKHKNGVAK
ncbi:hypothetical protein KW783_01115 [Candidatus Parcubacteria bacterium]|nr:hypothetical protein [Candidatus Parcubacteria bacterium]